jgi:hypothetical protein
MERKCNNIGCIEELVCPRCDYKIADLIVERGRYKVALEKIIHLYVIRGVDDGTEVDMAMVAEKALNHKNETVKR